MHFHLQPSGLHTRIRTSNAQSFLRSPGRDNRNPHNRPIIGNGPSQQIAACFDLLADERQLARRPSQLRQSLPYRSIGHPSRERQ